MHPIRDHEFVRNEEGGLTLLLDVVSFDEANSPTLMVSNCHDTAYLRRSPGDVHEIIAIHPDILKEVRTADTVIVMEILGDTVAHAYSAPTALLEEDDA